MSPRTRIPILSTKGGCSRSGLNSAEAERFSEEPVGDKSCYYISTRASSRYVANYAGDASVVISDLLNADEIAS